MVIPSWIQCICITDELDCNGNATADGGIRGSSCCWRVSCLSAAFLWYWCYYPRGSWVRTMHNKQCNFISWAEKIQFMEKKRLFKWCPPAKVRSWFPFSSSSCSPLELWAAGAFGSPGGLQVPLCIQESHGGSGSVSCSWFTCRVCTSVLYLKLQHFSAGAGVKGADPAETGKAHDPEKWFEILKESVKAGAPLSKYIKWEKFSVCDHAKG